jgi:phosphoglycolate phosphatase-like HAD superfamily hydrolase
MKLILFDIDGTLIRSHGGGRAAMQAALEEVFGTAGPIDNYRMGGKTDARIIMDLLAGSGIETADIEAQLPTIYELMTTKAHMIFPDKKMVQCLGVPELLTALNEQNDVLLGLLTGNNHLTAPLKLAAADIHPEQFRLGAYGSDAQDRNDLPVIAWQRAKELTGIDFDGKNTVIIGDTPADILCARAGQATAVAVASGWHAANTLAQYRPDYLFDNLADTQEVLAALLEW